MFDLSGSYQSALVLNVLTAWVASGVILWVSEWWRPPQRVPSPAG
jgi:hypothetical protein